METKITRKALKEFLEGIEDVEYILEHDLEDCCLFGLYDSKEIIDKKYTLYFKIAVLKEVKPTGIRLIADIRNIEMYENCSDMAVQLGDRKIKQVCDAIKNKLRVRI